MYHCYHSLSLIAICCHMLPLVVPLFVTRCHSLYYSLSLVVIRCTTLCHSLYHSLSFVVTRCTTRCHSMSFVVTRCTTRLSFYKWSLKKIKNFITILLKFVFSDIINGYWMKSMAINAVTDLEDHLFCFLKQRDRKIIFENNLTYLWSAIHGKKYPTT